MSTPSPASLPTLAAAGSRVALVTGAGKRLGRDIALTLARQGWDVAVHCRASRSEAEATAAEIVALGRRASVLCADLSDEAATRTLVPQAVAALGQLDAVVNSASTFEYDTAATFSYAQLETHLRANTAPAIVLAQLLAEHLAGRAAQGAVVNLLDQKLWNPNPDFLSYTLSKAALESATTLLALALAPHVRMVGVAPGLTLTSEWLQGEAFARAHQLSPLGRSSTAEDVATTVAFALANRSITGTTLLVDGGQHLQRFERDFSMM
ncbi:MAG TPA: SDR family oxidoreductase [Aquabacterium sp.]|nr:SDR family oxidoreductase [Aquabacterium sp.]